MVFYHSSSEASIKYLCVTYYNKSLVFTFHYRYILKLCYFQSTCKKRKRKKERSYWVLEIVPANSWRSMLVSPESEWLSEWTSKTRWWSYLGDFLPVFFHQNIFISPPPETEKQLSAWMFLEHLELWEDCWEPVRILTYGPAKDRYTGSCPQQGRDTVGPLTDHFMHIFFKNTLLHIHGGLMPGSKVIENEHIWWVSHLTASVKKKRGWGWVGGCREKSKCHSTCFIYVIFISQSMLIWHPWYNTRHIRKQEWKRNTR